MPILDGRAGRRQHADAGPPHPAGPRPLRATRGAQAPGPNAARPAKRADKPATYTEAAVLEATLGRIKGNIEDKPAFMKAVRSIKVDTCRGPVSFEPILPHGTWHFWGG